jgi:phosphatidylserine/phosphatidylglycerophosphate/cardiolipin synthase-like enzyme
MPRARRRRAVAATTALLVLLGGTLMTLSPSGAAAAHAAAQHGTGHRSHHRIGHTKALPHQATAAKPAAGHHGRAQRKTHKKAQTKAQTKARKRAAAKAAAKARAEARRKAAARAKARAEARIRARWAKVRPGDPHTWPTWAPDHYTPPAGPKFNNPYAHRKKRRALLTHVVRTIDSTPGYRLLNPVTHRRMRCPADPRLAPSTIRIAVYSVADLSFADALARAQRRCVSVKVLMNSHLTALTSRSWGRIVKALGKRPHDWNASRSFAMRCTNGCLGTSVLHAKFFLFSRAGRAHDIVMTGSTNMTSNAVNVQWNDLFTVDGNPQLYDQFRAHFRMMLPDRAGKGPWTYEAGRYRTTFFPAADMNERNDDVMRTLRNVSCRGARDGAGIRGRTVLYVAMHAWFGVRGQYIADEVRHLQRQGCYVRVLYSFMSLATFEKLGSDRLPRMVVRRVQFPGALGLVATKYSHMKMLAISGHLGPDRSAWVTWTGSNNWTDRGDRADEVTLRISSRAVYRKYVRHWKHMRDTRSTAVWAKFPEPVGGGRAP